jgi:hypothetical protein
VVLPWSLLCAVRGRTYVVGSLEQALTTTIIVFMVLLLLRWTILLALQWNSWTFPFRLPTENRQPPIDKVLTEERRWQRYDIPGAWAD